MTSGYKRCCMLLPGSKFAPLNLNFRAELPHSTNRPPASVRGFVYLV